MTTLRWKTFTTMDAERGHDVGQHVSNNAGTIHRNRTVRHRIGEPLQSDPIL